MLVNFTHSMFFPFHKSVYNSKYVKSFILATWLYLITLTLYQLFSKAAVIFSVIFSIVLYWIVHQTSNVYRYKNNNINSISSYLKYVYGLLLSGILFLPFLHDQASLLKIQSVTKKIFFYLFSVYVIRNILYLSNARKRLLVNTGQFYIQHSILVLLAILACTLFLGYVFDLYNPFVFKEPSKNSNQIDWIWGKFSLTLQLLFYISFFVIFNFKLYKYIIGNNIVLFPLIYKYNKNSMYNYTSIPFIVLSLVCISYIYLIMQKD